LAAKSRRPKSSPATKILDQHRAWIRELRNRSLGSRRIQSELKRAYDFDVSRTTIDKVLKAMDVKPLSRPVALERAAPGMPGSFLVNGFRWTPAKLRQPFINTPPSMTAHAFA
jgi:hypothetical protein